MRQTFFNVRQSPREYAPGKESSLTAQLLHEVLNKKEIRKNPREFLQERLSTAPSFTPELNLFANGHEIFITVLLPGLKLAGFDLEADEQEISMKGEVTTPLETLASRQFQRSLKLPFEIDLESIHAEYSHGLLSIKASIQASKSARKITLRHGDKQ